MEMAKPPNPKHQRSIVFFGVGFYWDGGGIDLLWQIVMVFFKKKKKNQICSRLWVFVVAGCGFL